MTNDYITVLAEPDEAMIEAGVRLGQRAELSGSYRWSDYMRDLYRAMIAASPSGRPRITPPLNPKSEEG